MPHQFASPLPSPSVIKQNELTHSKSLDRSINISCPETHIPIPHWEFRESLGKGQLPTFHITPDLTATAPTVTGWQNHADVNGCLPLTARLRPVNQRVTFHFDHHNKSQPGQKKDIFTQSQYILFLTFSGVKVWICKKRVRVRGGGGD